MDISSVNSDLIRGNVTTIILGSLWSQDRYGYDILKEIETRSEGQYKLKQPTLYNQLKRLEKQGLISSYDGDPEDTGGGRRRYYSLTAEGRKFLVKERTEYEYSRTILDRLVSDRAFDFEADPAPFNTDDLRPYIKKDQDKSRERGGSQGVRSFRVRSFRRGAQSSRRRKARGDRGARRRQACRDRGARSGAPRGS